MRFWARLNCLYHAIHGNDEFLIANQPPPAINRRIYTKFKWIFIHRKSIWVTTTLQSVIRRNEKNQTEEEKKNQQKAFQFHFDVLLFCLCLCLSVSGWYFSNFPFTCISQFGTFHRMAVSAQQYTMFVQYPLSVSFNFDFNFLVFCFVPYFHSFYLFSFSLLLHFWPSYTTHNVYAKNKIKKTKTLHYNKAQKQRVIFWLFSSQTVNMVGCILVNHWVCTMWQFLWSFQAEIIPFSSVIV